MFLLKILVNLMLFKYVSCYKTNNYSVIDICFQNPEIKKIKNVLNINISIFYMVTKHRGLFMVKNVLCFAQNI